MAHDEVDRFEQLYRAHVDALFAYAAARTTPDQVIEAVEETFLVAWRRLEDVPPEPRVWLCGVARRVLAQQRRARDRRAALGLRIAASRPCEHHGDDPAEVVADRDSARIALERLPDADRELLCLVAGARLSADEAAQVLGCSKPTLLMRLHRARRRFAAALDDEDDPHEAGQPPNVVNPFQPAQPLLSKEIVR